MKVAYVRTGGRGGGSRPISTHCVQGGGGGGGLVKNWQIFAYVLYGWPLITIYSMDKISLYQEWYNNFYNQVIFLCRQSYFDLNMSLTAKVPIALFVR